MSDTHDAAHDTAATQYDTQHDAQRIEVGDAADLADVIDAKQPPAKQRRARASKAAPFQRRENLSDDDRCSFTLPHSVEKLLLAQRVVSTRPRRPEPEATSSRATIRERWCHGLTIIEKCPTDGSAEP
jgi:hypothetical protein